MVSHSDAAPGEFADAARSTFIYAPIAAVVGAGLVAVGAGTEVGFLVFLGVVACIASVVVGLTGVAGMIRSGQRLLARHHEAAGLAIRHYRGASVGRAAASAKPPVTATPAVPQKDVSGDVA